MTLVYVDPWYLSFGDANDPREVDDYIAGLISIHDAVVAGEFQCAISLQAGELLVRDGCYPLAEQLVPEAWAQRSDIFRLVAGILNRTSAIERDDDIDALLVDEVAEVPEIYTGDGGCGDHLRELIARILVHTNRAVGVPLLLTRLRNSSAIKSDCSCAILDVQGTDVRTAAIGGPSRHEGEVSLLSCISQLLCALDSESVWAAGHLELGLKAALAADIALVGNSWTISEQFLSSFQMCGFRTNRGRAAGALRACIDAIRNQNLAHAHRMRVNKGAEAKPIRRADGAVGWRRDIDREWHLHYWVNGASIEFSRIVAHNDFRM